MKQNRVFMDVDPQGSDPLGFSKISGFYGPGAWGTWFLTGVMAFYSRREGIDEGLLYFILYATFANIDLLWRFGVICQRGGGRLAQDDELGGLAAAFTVVWTTAFFGVALLLANLGRRKRVVMIGLCESMSVVTYLLTSTSIYISPIFSNWPQLLTTEQVSKFPVSFRVKDGFRMDLASAEAVWEYADMEATSNGFQLFLSASTWLFLLLPIPMGVVYFCLSVPISYLDAINDDWSSRKRYFRNATTGTLAFLHLRNTGWEWGEGDLAFHSWMCTSTRWGMYDIDVHWGFAAPTPPDLSRAEHIVRVALARFLRGLRNALIATMGAMPKLFFGFRLIVLFQMLASGVTALLDIRSPGRATSVFLPFTHHHISEMDQLAALIITLVRIVPIAYRAGKERLDKEMRMMALGHEREEIERLRLELRQYEPVFVGPHVHGDNQEAGGARRRRNRLVFWNAIRAARIKRQIAELERQMSEREALEPPVEGQRE